MGKGALEVLIVLYEAPTGETRGDGRVTSDLWEALLHRRAGQAWLRGSRTLHMPTAGHRQVHPRMSSFASHEQQQHAQDLPGCPWAHLSPGDVMPGWSLSRSGCQRVLRRSASKLGTNGIACGTSAWSGFRGVPTHVQSKQFANIVLFLQNSVY